MNTAPEKKKMSLGKKILIGVGILIAIGMIANMGKEDSKAEKMSATSTTSDNNSSGATTASVTEPSGPGVGQTLKTDYFDVTITKVSVTDKVNTGNEFSDVEPEAGTKFLVLNTTFKNTDDESRMLTDGEVYITYNGKEYNFDKSETIMADGYGLFLDQINPLTSKTTKLVYKLPEEITGDAYYHPGRSDSDARIYLGKIK